MCRPHGHGSRLSLPVLEVSLPRLCRRILLAMLSSAAVSCVQGQVTFADRSQAPITIHDGGTNEVLQSIFIPPKPQAPFSLTLETEWSRALPNGGSQTFVNRRHIARDSAGRIYGERWILVPKNSGVESKMNLIQITLPDEHSLYNSEVFTKRCTLVHYPWSTTTKFQPDTGRSGPLPNGRGSRASEELGAKPVAGITATGYLETTTYNVGTLGNDQPLVMTREFWHSPQLGINLLSYLETPSAGKQRFTVVELSTAEPDPALFAVPAGYTIVDTRQQSQAQP